MQSWKDRLARVPAVLLLLVCMHGVMLALFPTLASTQTLFRCSANGVLTTTQQGVPNPATLGGTITYTLTITATGDRPDALCDVGFRDDLSSEFAGASFASFTPDANWNAYFVCATP